MALNVRQALEIAKSAPRSMKVIAAVAAVDLIVLLFAASMLEGSVGDQAIEVEQLKDQVKSTREKINTTRSQINRLPELRRLYDAAIADGVLADQDRLKFVSRIQDLGKQYRQSDLHYRLDAEDSRPLNPSRFRLVTTPVDVNDHALLDSDVLAFWEQLLGKLQAHFQVTSARLARSQTQADAALNAIRQGSPVSLVDSDLNFRWTSLRETPEAEKKK